MECNVIKDLIPLYIDGCCSEESGKIVKEHIEGCEKCRKIFDEMSAPSEIDLTAEAPTTFSKLNDWKASVLQSIFLFVSFALITLGVALEAQTPLDSLNGFWAINLVIPSTGFMLSLANWYFVRIYKSRKRFSDCSLIATLSITVLAFIWSAFHYGTNIFEFFRGLSFIESLDLLFRFMGVNLVGVCLTVLFCILSKAFSDIYAELLGKE